MANVLVTGGAGFIGSHLVDELVCEGHDVTILDDLSSGFKANVNSKAEFIRGDVSDFGVCINAVLRKQFVFHLAAIPEVSRSLIDTRRTNDVNLKGTLNILEASLQNGVQRVIFAGSSAVYGNTNIIPTDETVPVDPLSPYALQKYASEEYCRLYSHLFGLDTVILRYFNVFGPRQNPESEYSAVIPKFIEAIAHGRKPIIYGDGNQERDFVYVKNVVHANILAMQHKGHGIAINVGSGQSINLKQLLRYMYKHWGDESVGIDYKPRRSGDVKISRADITRLRVSFNYKPLVLFDEGILDTMAYYIRGMAIHQSAES